MKKKYDFEDRLIAFAGEVILISKGLERNYENDYLKHQLIRSSSSAALNFAESQGTNSTRDYLNKGSIALKELKESLVNLKLMKYIGIEEKRLETIKSENIELIKILRTILKNKRLSTSTSTSSSA